MTDIIRHLVSGQPVPVRNPSAVRPWQHVLEPLSGYLALAARMLASDEPQWCGAWNFGPQQSDEVPVRDLVERVCRAWGQGTWKDVSDPAQPHEAAVLRLSIDKAMSVLGWRPVWNLAATVDRTVAWYRRYQANPGHSMRDASLGDIAAYETERCCMR